MNLNTTSQNNRLEYIDSAKGICISILVYYHIVFVYEVHIPLTFLLYTFFIPLFFFTSGLFFKTYDGFKEFIRKKTNQLIIPFLFWLLANAILLPILDPYMGNWKIPTFSELTTNIVLIPQNFYQEEYYVNSIWFIWCLILINLIYYPIKKLSSGCKKETLILVVSSLAIGITGICLAVFRINIPFFIDTTLTVLPFFMMGNVLKKQICSESKIKNNWLFLVLAIAAFATNYLLSGTNLIRGHFVFRPNESYDLAWLTVYPLGLIGTFGVIWITRFFKKMPLFSYFGQYSLIILVTHRYVFQLFGYFLNHLPLNNNTAFAINLILTLSSYLILIPVIKKLMPHVTAQKDVIKQ